MAETAPDKWLIAYLVLVVKPMLVGVGLSPLQKGLQLFHAGSGSRDAPVTAWLLTKPLLKHSSFQGINKQNVVEAPAHGHAGDEQQQQMCIKVTFCLWTMTPVEESVLQRQDRPAGDLAELKYPPHPEGILL